VLVVAAAVALMAAFTAIGDTFLLVFVGIFLALVFEYPVRLVTAKTGMSRGLAATVTVLGAAVIVFVLALLLLAPMVGAVRDFLQELPATVEELRESDELSWLGDSGAAENVQSGADEVSASVPDTISALLGVAGSFFTIFVASFTVLFVCLFFLLDVANLRNAVASVLGPAQAARTIDLWERITRIISRWAIGALAIAVIAGTIQGTTAWILGSSYALALGLIAGFFDLIPNIGATIAGFILTVVLLAEEGLTAALIMLAVVLVYQQVENNLLTPTIQGKATNISGFFVITGVTVFGALLGVLGALIAVPVVASLQIVAQELTKDRRERMAAAKAAAGLPPDADPSPAV
jgi:predicted PurR-regulated permease PerM